MTAHGNTIQPTAGLFTMAQLASVFSRSERTVWRWIQMGKINAVTLAGKNFISEAEYARLLAEIGELTELNIRKYFGR